MGGKKRISESSSDDEIIEEAEDLILTSDDDDDDSSDEQEEPKTISPKPKKKSLKTKEEDDAEPSPSPAAAAPVSVKPMERRKKRKQMDKERHKTEEKKVKVPKVQANTDAAVASSSSSSKPVFHISVFNDLAAVDSSIREAATETLVTELRDVQKEYNLAEKKGGDDGSQLEAEKKDGLDNCASSLRYAIRRLIRGVSSSRECARQGFALGLTVVLKTIPDVKLDALMKLITDILEVNSSMKGQEAKDCLLGRLFAYGAIARSGRVAEEWISNNDTPYVKEFTSLVIALASKKRYLREPAVSLIMDLAEKKMVQIVEIEDHTTVTVNDEACPAPPLGTPTRAQPRHINKPRRIEPAKQKVDTEEQVNIYSIEDWKDSLDDIGKGGLGLGTVALIGLTVTSTLQRSIDTRDECNTGPDAMLDILKMGGMGFCFVTISLSVSIATKMIARKYKSKNQELFKRRVFRSGVMISALAVVLGLSCLGFYFRDFFEVRLGRRGAFMTNMFLAWGGLGGLMILGAASFAFLTC